MILRHKTRNIGRGFLKLMQSFHILAVRQNVEYGLKIRKVPKAEMKQRVDEILKIVKIEEYQDRLPERLSGGAAAKSCACKSDSYTSAGTFNG